MNFSAVDLEDTFSTNIKALWNFSSECTKISTRNNLYLQYNLSKCKWRSQLARHTPIPEIVY